MVSEVTHKSDALCILVVEDDPMVRLFIVGYLRDQGYAVVETDTGEAIHSGRYCRRNRGSCVRRMPGIELYGMEQFFLPTVGNVAALARHPSGPPKPTNARESEKPPLPPRRGLPSHLVAVIETRHTDFVTSNAAACSRG